MRGTLELNAPKGSVWLHQLKAHVPSLMVPPYHLRLGNSSARGIDQPHPLAKRQSCADYGQASRLTDVYGNPIGALRRGALFPFDFKFHAGHYSRIGAEVFPAVLERAIYRDSEDFHGNIGGHRWPPCGI